MDQGLDSTCILDVMGVGYEVHVPLGSLGRLAASERVTLHVHTQLREDALTLYGFATGDDRAAFRTLISVTGIGPKLALGILSAMSAADLSDAINRGDRNRFKGVSGVGKKLVERLVLELKDKLPAHGATLSASAGRPLSAPGYGKNLGAVHGALVQMGFKPVEAEHAISHLEQTADGKPTEELLREALSILA